MPEVQYVYTQRRTAEAGQAGTATYDLPERGFIPEIVVRAYSTPTAAAAAALPLNVAITKIEVVDGSKIIKSLNGNQVRALQMIHDRKELVLTERNANAVQTYGDFKLILAKLLNGIDYCPDFSMFSNPQIKISWDYSLVADKGVTYDADVAPAMEFSVICKVVRGTDHGYTHGYVKSSSIKIITQAVSATHVVEVPRGHPLIGLMIDAGYANLDWGDDCEEIKLDFDNGAWVPFHFYEEEVNTIMDMWFDGPFEVSWNADLCDAIEYDIHMGFVQFAHTQSIAADDRNSTWLNVNRGIDSITLVTGNTGIALAVLECMNAEVRGYIPFQCWYTPMTAMYNGTGDTIDTTAYGRIELEITSGAAANAASRPEVIAEYLVTAGE